MNISIKSTSISDVGTYTLEVNITDSLLDLKSSTFKVIITNTHPIEVSPPPDVTVNLNKLTEIDISTFYSDSDADTI